jgi:hypothetical protein
VISGFLRDVDEICALLEYYAEFCGDVSGKPIGPTLNGQGSRLLDRLRWYRWFIPKRRYGIIIQRCVIAQKSTDLMQYIIYSASQGSSGRENI